MRLLVLIFVFLTLSVQAEESISPQKKISAQYNSPPFFSTEELSWIKQNPIVTFTGDPNWLPYEAFDENGYYKGIVAEYLLQIEAISGLKFKKIPTKNWSESLQIAVEKKVSIISGDSADDILNQHFNPVTPYRNNPIVIVTNKDQNFIEDLNSIADKNIAIIKDYGYTTDIFKVYPNINFTEVENIQEGLVGIADGEYDAMLATIALASFTISNMNLHNLKITGKTPIVMDLTLFVDKREPILQNIIEKSLRLISDEQIIAIDKKWVPQSYVEKVDYTLLVVVSLFLLAFVGILTYKNRQLKRLTDWLENSSTRYRSVVATSPDGFIMLNVDGTIIEVNDKLCEMSGYTESELVGQNLAKFDKPNIEISGAFESLPSRINRIIQSGTAHLLRRYLKKMVRVGRLMFRSATPL